MWLLLILVPIALYIVVAMFSIHSILGFMAFIMLSAMMVGFIFDAIDPMEYEEEE